MFLNLLLSVYLAITPATVYASNQMPSVLSCIVQHESGGEQFWPDGSPKISPTGDVGIMQIHMADWLPLSKKMGLDILNNPKDNIEFGIYLLDKYGPTQWSTYKEYCNGSDTS